MTVIDIQNLWKRYNINKKRSGYKTFRDAITELLPWNYNKKNDKETFWALQDISFKIEEGEIVAIVGRNGSGKSTLLKILSQITPPTKGKILLYGHVASLLEVGTGFHPELTGRENVFLNGVILGMSYQEVQKNFDEIVAFSEIERFIDTPVKHYSSGMRVRLAFAVAAFLNPEILIIDEVLAVGDANFQKKCLGKVEDIQKTTGKTVLFVSHDMLAVRRLCKRAIWLQEGLLKQDDIVEKVASDYIHYLSSALTTKKSWESIETAPGNEAVRLLYIGVHSMSEDGKLYADMDFTIEIVFVNLKENSQLNISLQIITEEGILAFFTHSANEENWSKKPLPQGHFKSICYFPKNFLNTSIYRIDFRIIQNLGFILYEHKDILSFEVEYPLTLQEKNWYGHMPGVIRPELEWHTEKL